MTDHPSRGRRGPPKATSEKAVDRARRARWLADNAEALESSNRWVEANGFPLAQHRDFQA